MDHVQRIEERNRRVEADKAWETSKVRRGIIALLTYLVAVWFMWFIEVPQPWLSALVPTGGYVFSTFSLGFVKKYWVKKVYKK